VFERGAVLSNSLLLMAHPSAYALVLNFDLSLKAHKSRAANLEPRTFSLCQMHQFRADLDSLLDGLAPRDRPEIVKLPIRICACYAHVQRPPGPPLEPLALLTVARPRARPTPRPRVPRDRNIGAFLQESQHNFLTFPCRYRKVSYLNISGTTK
jgi:hypothetical protein